MVCLSTFFCECVNILKKIFQELLLHTDLRTTKIHLHSVRPKNIKITKQKQKCK